MNHLKSLLGPADPPTFEIVNATGKCGIVLVCDHASNRIPAPLGNLGLSPQQLADHISWDPGAAQVARALASRLDAPLILSAYSRLVIDCNRPLRSPQLIAVQSAGVSVPGNQNLSDEQRNERINHLFLPYHHAIKQLLDTRGQQTTAILSIHSFTPALDGMCRPWHCGIAYQHESQLAQALYNSLRRNADLNVGFNQPYQIDDETDYTIPIHGESRGLPGAMVEIRQDGLTTDEATGNWGLLLSDACRESGFI